MRPTLRIAITGAVSLAMAWGCEGPVGPQGPQGPGGPSGAAGPTGAVGQNGQDGQDGTNGENGQPGTPGTPGPTGQGAHYTGKGFKVTILGAGIDATGTATVGFNITDENGVALDKDGVYTEGRVSLSFILARLDVTEDGKAAQYFAYTTRLQGSQEQAAPDQGGSWRDVDPTKGTYVYTFGARAPGTDRAKTHSIGVYGTRAIDGVSVVANATIDFRPDRVPVTVRRRMITNDGCNACHDQLAVHGGARQQVELCILCHQPQSIDPDTGNTVDFPVMIHKIHRGKDLPSVKAGGRYTIVGFQQSVHDYSTVAFPQDIRSCQTCHTGPDADFGTNRPNRFVCGSCHDNISFDDPLPAGKTLHSGGAQPNDTACRLCHPATGGFAGIREKHEIPLFAPTAPKLAVELRSIVDTGPGQAPTLTFRVTVNDQPRNIEASPLTSLRATVAGPNTDYAKYWQATIQGSGAVGVLTAVDASDGVFRYMFPSTAAIPADASGSYTVALEGYLQPQATDPRFALTPPQLAFAVTGTVTPRRQVVANEKCNSCHAALAGHGGSRVGGEYCSMCHNPNNVNDERMSRLENASALVHSVDLKFMIHRIHTGEELDQPFVLGGFPAPTAANPAGTPIDFKEVRYPGIRSNCNHCHVDDSWAIGSTTGRLSSREEIRACTEVGSTDGDQLCELAEWSVASTTVLPPIQAACRGCHDSEAAGAHAEVNTTALGKEACAVCHGPGAELDVAKVHAIR